MISLVLFLTLLRFNEPAPDPGTTQTSLEDSRVVCYVNAEGYFFYVGPDGMIGVAKKSCEDAYNAWRDTKAQPEWKV